MALGGRLRELLDGLSPGVEWSDAFWRYSVTLEGERSNTELRLVHVDLHAVVLQAGEDLVKALSVRGFVWASDEQVVNVGETEGQATDNLVDKALEGLACVHEPKRHSDLLKETKGSDDGRLWYVISMDWNLVEGSDEVHT